MKRNSIISLLAMAAIALSIWSCSKKENFPQDSGPSYEAKVSFSLSAGFSDFNEVNGTTSDTKASLQSVFRMTWNEKDTVHVFGKADGQDSISHLGTLVAAIVDGSDGRVADLSGEITAPEAGTKITLVYSPLFTGDGPAVGSDTIGVNLSVQYGKMDSVTFIAYAAVDYDSTASAAYRTSFKFATNVLRVNLGGLVESENDTLALASIQNIEGMCKLKFSADGEPQVTGVKTVAKIPLHGGKVTVKAAGTIVKFIEDGTGLSFYVATPPFTTSSERILGVMTGSFPTLLAGNNQLNEGGLVVKVTPSYFTNFATGGVPDGGNMLNTVARDAKPVYQIRYVEKDEDGTAHDFGYGTYVPATEAVWAPVNCGYRPGIYNDGYNGGYTYGKLYQWGRKYGYGIASGDIESPDQWDETCIGIPMNRGIPIDTLKNKNRLSTHPDAAGNPDKFYWHNTRGNFTQGEVSWYYDFSNGYNWYDTDNTDVDKLWIHDDEFEKGTYDPCPEGWRVPTANELSFLYYGLQPAARAEFKAPQSLEDYSTRTLGRHGSSSVLGCQFNAGDGISFVFLPLAGFASGQPEYAEYEQACSPLGWGRGSVGAYWSSTVDEQDKDYWGKEFAVAFLFDAFAQYDGDCRGVYGGYGFLCWSKYQMRMPQRSCGFSVRCVQIVSMLDN